MLVRPKQLDQHLLGEGADPGAQEQVTTDLEGVLGGILEPVDAQVGEQPGLGRLDPERYPDLVCHEHRASIPRAPRPETVTNVPSPRA